MAISTLGGVLGIAVGIVAFAIIYTFTSSLFDEEAEVTRNEVLPSVTLERSETV